MEDQGRASKPPYRGEEMGKLLRLNRAQPVRSPNPARSSAKRSSAVAPSEILGRMAALERCAVFFAQDASLLRLLARRARRLEIPAGSVVVSQGEPGDCLYVIARGYCLVRVEPAAGHVILLAQLGPGELFGEDAFLSGEASHVSIVASNDVRVIAIDRATLHSVVHAGAALLEELARFADQRRQAFAEMTVQADWARLTDSATVVGVYSPKGGTGRTTVAVNLVARLAARHPRQVVLLDLAFPFPHAALMANLVPGTCLARLHDTPSERFEEALLSAVLYHPGGLTILPGSLQAEEADLVSADLVTRAVEILRRTFRYVVVDLGVALSDVSLAVFDQCQHVLMVVTPEITAIKGATEATDILEVLGIPAERQTVVLNHRTPAAALSRGAVERGLRREVAFELPYDGTRPEVASTRGGILSLESPKSELVRAIEALASGLVDRGLPVSKAAGQMEAEDGRAGET